MPITDRARGSGRLPLAYTTDFLLAAYDTDGAATFARVGTNAMVEIDEAATGSDIFGSTRPQLVADDARAQVAWISHDRQDSTIWRGLLDPFQGLTSTQIRRTDGVLGFTASLRGDEDILAWWTAEGVHVGDSSFSLTPAEGPAPIAMTPDLLDVNLLVVGREGPDAGVDVVFLNRAGRPICPTWTE